MTRIAIATAALIALALPAATPAAASDATEIMKTIRTLNDDLNKGDMDAPASLYTQDATIIDEFAPHFWSGAHAHADWIAAFEALAKAEAITGVKLTLGKPLHVNVEGDRAYVVLPTRINDKTKGKAHVEHGLWTFAMQKTSGGWMIAGWSWTTK